MGISKTHALHLYGAVYTILKAIQLNNTGYQICKASCLDYADKQQKYTTKVSNNKHAYLCRSPPLF